MGGVFGGLYVVRCRVGQYMSREEKIDWALDIWDSIWNTDVWCIVRQEMCCGLETWGNLPKEASHKKICNGFG